MNDEERIRSFYFDAAGITWGQVGAQTQHGTYIHAEWSVSDDIRLINVAVGRSFDKRHVTVTLGIPFIEVEVSIPFLFARE